MFRCRNVCFEVWGFDILLDASATCWLIEANTCPSLAGDSPLDRRVKLAMVKDLMHMVSAAAARSRKGVPPDDQV